MEFLISNIMNIAQKSIDSGRVDCAREAVAEAVSELSPESDYLTGEDIDGIIMAIDNVSLCGMGFMPGETSLDESLVCTNISGFYDDRFEGIQNILTEGDL